MYRIHTNNVRALKASLAGMLFFAAFSANAATFTVNDPSCATSFTFNAATQTLACDSTTVSPAPSTPTAPSCSIGGTTTITAGQSTTLTASCNGTAPFTYTWSGGASASTQSVTVTPSATTQYNLTVSNGTAPNWSGSASVTVNPVATTSGTCANPNTHTTTVDFATDRGRNFYLAANAGQWAVIKFTTPNITALGSIQFTSSQVYMANKTISLSYDACNFTNPIGYLTQGAPGSTLGWALNRSEAGFYRLNPDTTYYLNVKNEVSTAPGVDTCPSGMACGFTFGLTY